MYRTADIAETRPSPVEPFAPWPELGRDVPIVLFVDASWEIGGLTGYVLGLARGFRRRGYTVAAICHPGDVVAPLRAALAETGVEVHAVEEGASNVRDRAERLRALVSVMRRYKGGVLALMMGYFIGGGVATLAGRLGGAGAIVRADLQPPVPPITRSHRVVLKLKDLITDRIVVGAQENVEAFARKMSRDVRKMTVINTGIELARFQPRGVREMIRASLGYAPDTLVVGTSARLSEERKGIHHFVEMAAGVSASYPSAEFLVIGEGLLRAELEQQTARLGIRDRVRFTGWRADVVDLLEGMDVYVMPSLFEGGPTTVLEAMAMGRPVVATRVGMVPEVIDHRRTGLIVEPGDISAMAAGVGELLANEPMRIRMGEQARAHAEREFSIDRMAERYLAVFAQAVGPSRARG